MSVLPENIYLVSQPLLRAKNKNEFHFTGYYQGRKIKKIIVLGSSFDSTKVYKLELRTLRIEASVLYTRMIRARDIFI